MQSVSLPGGHKDALWPQVYKAQDWSELQCSLQNKGGHRNTLLNKRHTQCHAFMRPSKQVTEPRAKREAKWTIILSYLSIYSPVDSIFKWSKCHHPCHCTYVAGAAAVWYGLLLGVQPVQQQVQSSLHCNSRMCIHVRRVCTIDLPYCSESIIAMMARYSQHIICDIILTCYHGNICTETFKATPKLDLYTFLTEKRTIPNKHHTRAS